MFRVQRSVFNNFITFAAAIAEIAQLVEQRIRNA